MFVDSKYLLIQCTALGLVLLICGIAPTPLALALMVVFGHAYFLSALGDTLRTTVIDTSFYLRTLALCGAVVGSNVIIGWAHWLDARVPHEIMAVVFLCYCAYHCVLRQLRCSRTSIGSHASVSELLTLFVLIGVCFSAYILLDHPISNMAHYLFEPAYFYLWFALHCACTSRFAVTAIYFEHGQPKPEATFGSVAM